LNATNAAAVVISKKVIGLSLFFNSISSNIFIKFLSEINFVEIPNETEEILPIYYTLLVQLLSFHLAKFNNLSIDQPRNLAKVVTVA